MDVRGLEEERDAFAEKRVYRDGFLLPDYDVFNIRNIKSIVGKIFGVNSLQTSVIPNEALDDCDGVQKVFLVVVDGFGYNRLLSYVRDHDSGGISEIIEKGVLKPFTSPFPATTSTSLASIFTGLTPADHGILGFQMFSREYGCVFNTLDMKPVYGYSSEVEIARDLSRRVKPWMPTLQTHGVKTLVATKGSIIGSGLSRVIHADQDTMPYILESEMFVKCRRALEQSDPILLTLYYSGIDTLEHRYGPDSEEVTTEIQSFEFLLNDFLGKISEASKKETLILLTSDHGVSETLKTVYLKDYPEIASTLQLPPVGDSRATFLFAKQGEKDNLRSEFEKNMDGFDLVATSDLVENGAFGRTSDSMSIQSTTGDLAALSKGPTGLSYPYYEDDRNREQRGGHGGMTAREVLVPLLSMRLAKV